MNEEKMTPERREYIENTIMSILFELYEDQTGTEYTWEWTDKDDKTA